MERSKIRGQKSLEEKLRLLVEGEEIGLTATEAAVYGVEYADEFLKEEFGEEDQVDGQ